MVQASEVGCLARGRLKCRRFVSRVRGMGGRGDASLSARLLGMSVEVSPLCF